MTDKLHFSLVSPARELFSGEVDHVIAPGTEGEFGVLVSHAPFMTTLKNGIVRVLDGDDTKQRIFIRGGFADVTPEGLTILAEEAIDLESADKAALTQDLQHAREELLKLSADDGKRLAMEEDVSFLEAVVEAASA